MMPSKSSDIASSEVFQSIRNTRWNLRPNANLWGSKLDFAGSGYGCAPEIREEEASRENQALGRLGLALATLVQGGLHHISGLPKTTIHSTIFC